ncbi:hypothetical protein DFH07DRAFT_775227 [Mycena maculata]|uniref:Uncharacterized protein n=1 Tax=Mycena maculata TaxID=230809 RepID=A0AAD7IVI7_9AGAR|nr:hypothetical protein DFH07DRAFT_775227 [Mycena maculata]
MKFNAHPQKFLTGCGTFSVIFVGGYPSITRLLWPCVHSTCIWVLDRTRIAMRSNGPKSHVLMWFTVLGIAVLFGVLHVYTRYVAALNAAVQSAKSHQHLDHWWNPGYLWPRIWRKTAYFNHPHNVISMVPLLVKRSCYCVGSMEVMKQLLGQEGKIQLWDMWRRHRQIVGPAFNAKKYPLVTLEAVHTYKAMASTEGWEDQEEVVIPAINPVILRFTFIIMARCGFGLPVSWVNKNDSSKTAALEEALSVASTTLIPRFIIPRWVYGLPIKYSVASSVYLVRNLSVVSRLHEIDQAWNKHLMGKLVVTRKEYLSLEDEVDKLKISSAGWLLPPTDLVNILSKVMKCIKTANAMVNIKYR